MPSRINKTPWSEAEDDRLLRALSVYQRDNNNARVEDVDWDDIAQSVPGRGVVACAARFGSLHAQGKYFATVNEVWPQQQVSTKKIKLGNWDTCRAKVVRSRAPDFNRLQLQQDPREPNEFVNTYNGALLATTSVADSITTVNDDLIPVDIFGQPALGTDKAHLLPKARDHALTWDYPACAVLGLDVETNVDTDVIRKALLGCRDSEARRQRKYPGIRNLLCNIVRMSNQGHYFDNDPYVFVFPICSLDSVKNWAGQGYDAIVICESAHVSQRIGMTMVSLETATTATLDEIHTAVGLASTICEFLGHSVLQKTPNRVNQYQDNGDIVAYQQFREEKKTSVPFCPSTLHHKPVFKISFAGHDDNDAQGKHPAPDPMLLAFKTCNNWCRKHDGFRMVAGAEPLDLDDGLSEEGKRNLQEYVVWQASMQKKQRHDEIMDLFGHNGGVITGSTT